MDLESVNKHLLISVTPCQTNVLNNTLCLTGTLNCWLLVNNLYFSLTFGKSATNHRQDKLLPLTVNTRDLYHDLIKKIKTDRNSAVKRSLGNKVSKLETFGLRFI